MSAKSRFQDKVAFVTGGASGIGFTTAETLVRDGAKVVIADINIELAKKSAASMGKNAVTFKLDTSDAKSVEEAIKFTEKEFGGLDLAVNAAGIQGPLGTMHQLDAASISKVFEVNSIGVAFCMLYEIEALRRRGGGAIVNIASICGMRQTPGLGIYSASKSAVIALSITAAAEYGPENIRVNTVSPGYVDTPLLPKAISRKWIEESTPTGRCGTPQDLADAITFLLSDTARQITGINVPVDGGVVASLSVKPPKPED